MWEFSNSLVIQILMQSSNLMQWQSCYRFLSYALQIFTRLKNAVCHITKCWVVIFFFKISEFEWIIRKITQIELECGTWYHHLRRLQCVLCRNLRIFKVATCHYRCRHNLKNNCIWDNLHCCLVPRSPISLWCWPLTCNCEKCYSYRSSFGMYNLERQLWYWHLLMRHCPCNLPPGANLS